MNVVHVVDSFVMSLWRRPRGVIGSAAVRAGLGAVGLLYYLAHLPERRMFFGPEAVWSWDIFQRNLADVGTFSLFAVSSSVWWFEAMYLLGIAAAVACTVGFGGRFGVIAHWVMLWSLYQRNPALLDGGDNVAYIVLLFVALTSSTHVLAVRHRWSRPARRWRPGQELDRPSIAVFIHNVGLVMIIGQVCLVYFTSGLYKLGGELWINGTALYYVLRIPEFMWEPVNPLLFTNGAFVMIGTYAAMLLLSFLPVLVLNRRIRPFAIVAVMGLHLSIAVLMGLWGFALTMIVCDVVLFGDEHLERAAARARSWAHSLAGRGPENGDVAVRESVAVAPDHTGVEAVRA